MIKTNDGQVQTETRRRCKEGREGNGMGGDTKRGIRKRKGTEQGKEKGWIFIFAHLTINEGTFDHGSLYDSCPTVPEQAVYLYIES
jgi:hypothetical protein